jgi:hypothetical protein
MIDVPRNEQHAPQAEETPYRLTALRAKRELRRLRAGSLLAVLGIIVAAVWLATWFPGGIRPADYNARVVATIVLLVAVMSAASAMTARWVTFLREEPLSELWMALAGQSMSVRSQSRFGRRVELQCHSAATDRRRFFAVVVVQIHHPDASFTAPLIDETLPALREGLRDGDVIGVAGPRELWVLLDQPSVAAGKRIADRLGEVIETSLASSTDDSVLVLAGYSAFGDDGRDAATLFDRARRRLAASDRGRAAVPSPASELNAA